VLAPRRGARLVGPAAPQIDHHLAVDVEGERGAEVFPRRATFTISSWDSRCSQPVPRFPLFHGGCAWRPGPGDGRWFATRGTTVGWRLRGHPPLSERQVSAPTPEKSGNLGTVPRDGLRRLVSCNLSVPAGSRVPTR